MFLYFFIISLISVHADLNSLWLEAGCTAEGVLSPEIVPHFWDTIPDHEVFIKQIQLGTQSGDRLSITSCLGDKEVISTGKTMEIESYSKTFHLLWECAEGDSACMLPPVHALCIRTLRTVHPQATIYLWSMTLNPTLMGAFLDEIDVELKHYDSTFFEGLPLAAVEASKDIQSFFKSEKDAYSHWSDLFRAAVLYKFGGVYTDLDSIWLRPIDQVSTATAWIPSTPTRQEKLEDHDVITIGTKKLFLEGGILRFDEPKSPFLWRVLSEFPKYTQEIAECWACVGPRQLTTIFNEFLAEDAQTPELIDSQKVFGLKHYRNYFHDMHSLFDPKIWKDTLTSNVVAAHMFSGTPQDGIAHGSTIYHLFQAGGVDDIVTKVSASWREVKERRGLLSSLYYLANTIQNPSSPNALTQAQMQQYYGSAFMIGEETVHIAQNAYISPSVEGQGSVVFYAGETSSVTSVVALSCQADESQINEIKNIYYSGFNVPLASVHATATATSVDVTVNEVDPENVSAQATAVSLSISQSELLCNGVVTEMNLPENGYTEATFVVATDVLTSSEHLAAQFEILDIIVEAFGIAADELHTTTTFRTNGQVTCALDASEQPPAETYEDELSAMFGGAPTHYDPETGNFWVEMATFNDAMNTRYYIANQAVSFSFSGFCFWVESTSGITVVSENRVRENGVTYTQMEASLDQAVGEFEASVDPDFTVTQSVVETSGTQTFQACQMLEECQNDYKQLYAESVGDLNIVDAADTEEVSWWWRFQLSAQGLNEINDLKLHNGRFVYDLGDGTYADTCVQHHSSWITPCDDTIGVCPGGSTYGYATQQATALRSALNTASLRHPDCPYGCQSLQHSDLSALYNSIVSATNSMEASATLDQLDNVCILNDKYYVYDSPSLLLDTCVGYSADADRTCSLSFYTFCSDITDSGYVIYGDSTMQGMSLTQALLSNDNRHPACL